MGAIVEAPPPPGAPGLPFCGVAAYAPPHGCDDNSNSEKRFLNFNTPNQKKHIIFIQEQGFVYTSFFFYDENSYLIKGLISYEFS